MDRAYSLFTVKSVDHEQRIVIGVATTPEPDKVDDIVEPLGVEFSNPLPLLLHHDTKSPVGKVWFDIPTQAGITFKAHLPEIAEDGTLKTRVDEAWQSVKYGLIPGVSIGFTALTSNTERRKTGGLHIKKSRVHELSLVTVPAHQRATITSIRQLKSLDVDASAVSGDDARVSPQTLPGATGSLAGSAIRRNTVKTIRDQISAFEASRQAKSGRMTDLMTTASEEGKTLDETQAEEYDGLESEIKNIDAHLVRLAALEKANVEKAVEPKGNDPEKASQTRGGSSVVVLKNNLPPGTLFTRYAMALAASRGSRFEAMEYAKQWYGSTPEVAMSIKASMNPSFMKAAMAPGTTTDSDWAAPLVVFQNLTNEFVELLRPATIIGRIPGLRRVPFNVTMPTQTQGSTVNWVGQAKPKPVSELKFASLSLGMAKVAGIIVISEELAKSRLAVC